MQRMAHPILTQIANEGYDFSTLDSDNWGDLDHLVIVHSGFGAENGNDPCGGNPAENRIWSQGVSSTANGWQSPDLLYTVSAYSLVSAFKEQYCDPQPALLGIVVVRVIARSHFFSKMLRPRAARIFAWFRTR